MEKHKINIAIIDDHQLLAEALAELLSAENNINEVKTYKSARRFLNLYDDNNIIDIIITEIVMVEMSGIDFLIELNKLNSPAKVIILSFVDEIKTIRFAIDNGARGYLNKDISSNELITAIFTVNQGEAYIGENLRKKLIRSDFQEGKNIYSLTAREKEVLNHVCAGKTIKEAASIMQLSIHTVQAYYKNILKKFNLNRTADLIVFAIQSGLYNPKTNNTVHVNGNHITNTQGKSHLS